MSEEQDIRSLLQSKARAKVNPRDSSLFVETNNHTNTDLDGDEEPKFKTDKKQEDNQQNSNNKKLQLEAELDSLPQIGKRLAIHLEQSIRNDLLKLCNDEEITPEIFFEAAFLLLKDKPKFKDKVVSTAKDRLQTRKRAGLVRRTLSIIDKLST